MRFKMAYSIEENDYLGQRSIQLYVKDIKFD
jgi:single-stranded-DNA-specific exonuclease